MRQIEITTYINQSLEEVDRILKQQGFQIIRRTILKDKYFSLRCHELNPNNIVEILSSCVILRYIISDGKIYKNITYKDKKYQGSTVLDEEIITVHIDEIEGMEKLLDKMGFKNLLHVTDDMIVYGNNEMEFGIQKVDGLGLLLEYENTKDFSNSSNEEIIEEKEKMLEQVKQYGLNISNDYDVKKAYELLRKNMNM